MATQQLFDGNNQPFTPVVPYNEVVGAPDPNTLEKIANKTDQISTDNTPEQYPTALASKAYTDQAVASVSVSGRLRGSYWFGKISAVTNMPLPTLIGQNYFDFSINTPYTANTDLSGWTAGAPIANLLDNDHIDITDYFVDLSEGQLQGRATWSASAGAWGYSPNYGNAPDMDTINKRDSDQALQVAPRNILTISENTYKFSANTLLTFGTLWQELYNKINGIIQVLDYKGGINPFLDFGTAVTYTPNSATWTAPYDCACFWMSGLANTAEEFLSINGVPVVRFRGSPNSYERGTCCFYIKAGQVLSGILPNDSNRNSSMVYVALQTPPISMPSSGVLVYKSEWLPMTIASVTHGLGNIPDDVSVKLKCIAADGSYLVGDVIVDVRASQDHVEYNIINKISADTIYLNNSPVAVVTATIDYPQKYFLINKNNWNIQIVAVRYS